MNVERFFMTAIPDMAARNFVTFIGLRGDIAITVRGVGTWTIHLGDSETPVSPGAVATAELKLLFSPTAFEHLVEGKLDVGKAVAERRVSFKGNISLLEKLGYLLSTGASPLATRIGQR